MNSSLSRFRPARFAVAALLLISLDSARAAAEADILIAFDNSYFDGAGGIDNAEVLTANSVAASNFINDQSGTGARMKIVGFHPTYGQGGRSDLPGYIGWILNYGDAELNDVSAAADAAGADLIAYICQPNQWNTSAANAQQPGRVAAYGPTHFWNNVVAHESGGHNYGVAHEVGRVNPTTIMMHNYCGGGSQAYYSNPNIWLHGTRLVGGMDGCTVVGWGDSAYQISAAAQGVSDRVARVNYGSRLSPVVHRWQFNQSAGPAPAGTTITSSVGTGALATVRGQGASFTGTGLRLPGGGTGNTAANSIAAYLDLPNGIFSSMPNWTIEMWATPQSGSEWARVFEIGRTVEAGDGLGAAGEYTGTPGSPAPGVTTASDVVGLGFARNTGSLGTQRLIAGINGTNAVADSDLATTAGVMRHYAITFTDTTAGATVRWFRDGALIKKLNVTFNSADIEDVNNWLGRSNWSGDTMSQIDFHDVRIIGVALADGQVAGNFRIGPHDAISTMWADDPYNSSAFVSGAWEGGNVPLSTRDYEVGAMLMRTPRNASAVTFPGKSLGVADGLLNLDATGTRTVTIADLRLNGGATVGAYTSSGTQTLAGNIKVKNNTENTVRGDTSLTISASISGGVGGGGITYVHNPGTTLTGNNTGYLGATIVGDGRFSTLRISNETQLGGNPSFYGGGWLQLNRGILETTSTMTIDDSNRGVLIGPSGGFLRPAAGTTLTIASTLNSPAAGNTLQTAPLFPNPVVGILFKDGPGTLVLTNSNNSYIGEMQVLDGLLRVDGAGRLNNGDMHMPIVLNSTLNLNTTADQILGGSISGGGTLLKNNTGTTTFYGANSFTGSVTINGGAVFARAANAANNRSFSFVSGITVNSGTTLKSQANSLFGWDGTQTRPITVNGGTLTTDAANTDVNVGNVTLNGGTLAGFASGQWGSWNFKRVASGKLRATGDATVSAPNVGLGTANSVDVSAGKTLTWSGALTDLTSEGACALVKSGGTGTLNLTGTNSYTGPTTVSTGQLIVSGNNQAATGTLTVAGGATLGGNGKLGGSVTIAAGGCHALAVAATPAAQVTRLISGTLDLTAVGDILDLTAATTPAPGSYTLITASAGITGTLGDTVVNMTGITGGSVAANGNSLVLTVTPASNQLTYIDWATSRMLTEANNGPSQDPDLDGIANVLEFVLGGDPLAADTAKLPSVTTTETDFIFTFSRSDDSEAEVILTFQHGADMTEWTDITIGATASGPVGVAENENSPDTVVVTIPKSSAVGGKLLGRLKAVK